jgi:hypothetical protein
VLDGFEGDEPSVELRDCRGAGEHGRRRCGGVGELGAKKKEVVRADGVENELRSSE